LTAAIDIGLRGLLLTIEAGRRDAESEGALLSRGTMGVDDAGDAVSVCVAVSLLAGDPYRCRLVRRDAAVAIIVRAFSAVIIAINCIGLRCNGPTRRAQKKMTIPV